MLQQGTVSALNARSGLFAIELSDGSFALAELLGAGQLSVGENIAGEMRIVGETSLKRLGTGDAVEAFIRAYDLSREAAEYEIS